MSALPLMTVGARFSFAHSSSNRPDFGVAALFIRRSLIRISKLRILQHRSVSAHEARVHHLRKLRYPPFISFKGSQPRCLYYGVCSEQHPSNQGELRDVV